MRNQSVAFQFWLDIGSLGWWERLYQPLTNPYVFRKNWVRGAIWTEQEEYKKVLEEKYGKININLEDGTFEELKENE